MPLGLRPTSLPSGILIHPAIWPQQILTKNWGLCPFGGEAAGSPSNTMSLGLRPRSIASGILSIQSFGHNRCGPKFGGAPPPFGEGGAGSPSNTIWPGPRTTCKPSIILIHPTVWPQYTNVTDRTDRQQSYSTGRTILQSRPKIWREQM